MRGFFRILNISSRRDGPQGATPLTSARGGASRSCCSCTKLVLKLKTKKLSRTCLAGLLDQLKEPSACGVLYS